MQATKFGPPTSASPLNGQQWAIVGAETQVFRLVFITWNRNRDVQFARLWNRNRDVYLHVLTFIYVAGAHIKNLTLQKN
jgi:hypothetical protein